MLSKLLKYEYKATARLFVPLYIALLVFALLNRLINPFQVLDSATTVLSLQGIFSMLTIMAYFALIVGVVAMTVVIMIQRFYKSLLGNEGYLMFTLPVPIWQHIVNKLLVALTWSILSYLVAMGSILIISGATGVWPQIAEALSAFWLFPLMALISLASATLMIYAAIALGHLFPKHKLIASFAMYCLLSIVSQVAIVLTATIAGTIFLPLFLPLLIDSGQIADQVNWIFFSLLLPALLLGCGYFALTNFILTKKLNLE